MSGPLDGMKYYMPLTKGLPKDGPTTSVFSVPQVQYSRETEAVVKNLMRESRLTFTQKHVFENILRNGQSLPEHPSQMMYSRLQQAYMKQCHRNKARKMGLSLLEPQEHRSFRNHATFGTAGPCRRTLETIRASGDLQPLMPPRSCIPASKEAEKDRLAHKMAFGKEMDPDKSSKRDKKFTTTPSNTMETTVDELKERRFVELIDEIQDRMQFLLEMGQAKKDKAYKDCILNQINEKLFEIRKLFPEKEKSVREHLHLELLDRRYRADFAQEHSPANFFDDR